jgi:hypothetical protein
LRRLDAIRRSVVTPTLQPFGYSHRYLNSGTFPTRTTRQEFDP